MASSSVGSDATMHSCPPWDLIWEHRLDMYMSLPCYSAATAGWFARTRSARSCSTRALARCALPTFGRRPTAIHRPSGAVSYPPRPISRQYQPFSNSSNGPVALRSTLINKSNFREFPTPLPGRMLKIVRFVRESAPGVFPKNWDTCLSQVRKINGDKMEVRPATGLSSMVKIGPIIRRKSLEKLPLPCAWPFDYPTQPATLSPVWIVLNRVSAHVGIIPALRWR